MVMSSAQCLKLHFTELHGMVTGPVRLDEGLSYKRKQLNPSLTTITGSAVALHCCKAHSKISRKMESSIPCKIVTPENFTLKLGTRDYVEEVTYYTIFDADCLSGGFSPNRLNITLL